MILASWASLGRLRRLPGQRETLGQGTAWSAYPGMFYSVNYIDGHGFDQYGADRSSSSTFGGEAIG